MKNIIFYICCFAGINDVFSQFVSTFAGSGVIGSFDAVGTNASFYYPSGICADASGNLYVTDQYNNKIRKITPAGSVTTFAGSGIQGSADGTGIAASFNRPFGICIDPAGNLYIGEIGNQKIRKITPAGVVTTLAGSGVAGSTDGVGPSASFNYPNGICIDATGNLFVADYFNNKVRMVTQAGVVTTFAGSGATGSVNATGIAASFAGPSAICIDASGNFFVSDFANNKVRMITAGAVVTTFAGSGIAGSTDAIALAASFDGPTGIYADISGDIYLSDQNNSKVRKISTGTVVSTFAGSGISGAADATVTIASFNTPEGLCSDGIGNIFVADLNNNKIRRIGSCSAPIPPTNSTPTTNIQVCLGNSTTLTAANSGTVTWFNTSTGGSPISTGIIMVVSNSLSVGTYTYYAEAFTCTTSVSRTPITITVNPLPTITVNSGTICSGQTFTMIPNGALNYTFSNGYSTVSPTTNTFYTVIGKDALGCLSSNTATSNVSVYALPTITVSSGSICSGNSFTMIPGGANTYTIQGGSAVVSPTATSSYTVVGTSSAGCVSNIFATSNVTVNSTPSISVNSGSICSGNSFTMVASGANTYTYSGGPVVSPTINTSYSVTGTSIAGCVSSNTAISNVTVSATPTITVAGGTICPGNSFTLNPSGANTYTYSGGQVVSPILSTTYSVSGTSTAGCASNGSAIVTVTVANALTITITGSNAICNGQTINLTAGGATTYSWNTGATTSIIVSTLTVNTTYSVVGVSGSCSNTAVKNITVNPLPTINVVSGNSAAFCSNQTTTLTATGANTYSWNTGPTTDSISISPTVTTSYTVTGNDANGCSNTGTITQLVVDCTGINQLANSVSEVNIYPNPTNNQFTIETNSNEIQTIALFDLSGRLMFTQTISDKTNIDVADLSEGVYNLSIKNGSNIINKKLVIVR